MVLIKSDLCAVTAVNTNKDLRELDNGVWDAERNVSHQLSKLLMGIEAINHRLQKTQEGFRKDEEVCYVPADYEGWFDSVTSKKIVRDTRNKWIQKMESKARVLNAFSRIEDNIEKLGKEYEIFKRLVGQFDVLPLIVQDANLRYRNNRNSEA